MNSDESHGCEIRQKKLAYSGSLEKVIFFGNRFHQERVFVDCVRLISIDLDLVYLYLFDLTFLPKIMLVYFVALSDH